MGALKNRRFLGVKFNCCHVYYRIYVNKAGTHYRGNCPRCGRPISIRIDPDKGIRARFFETK
ncbi:MAG: hypothetical protein AB1896_22905 [Thermodesulfobacteriota bacterium]